jgi:hypothetical protein
MKNLFLFAAIFGFVATVHAQTVPYDGFGLPVTGSAPDTAGTWIDECRFNLDGETCVVTIKYASDVYPVEFLQDDKVLEAVHEKESYIGFQVVEGVKFEKLPNGGYSYVIEVRNPRGRLYLGRRVGS